MGWFVLLFDFLFMFGYLAAGIIGDMWRNEYLHDLEMEESENGKMRNLELLFGLCGMFLCLLSLLLCLCWVSNEVEQVGRVDGTKLI